MEEEQKEFYQVLGLLATKFSVLEFYSKEILSLLISKNENLLSATILEGMPFSRKIELIKKLSDFRSEQGKDLKKLASEMKSIKNVRNLFIHGLWKGPKKGTTGYYISVEETALKKTQNDRRISWTFNQFHSYSKDKLERLVVTVDLLIKMSEKTVTKLNRDISLDA